MKKSIFIAYDGIDACGKTTHVRLLQERLMLEYLSVTTTEEPSDGKIGQFIRNDLLSGKEKVDKRVIDAMFMADRIDHITKKGGILDALDNGISVVSSRYLLSGVLYYAANMLKESAVKSPSNVLYDAFAFQDLVSDILLPDLTVIINIPVDIAIDRINKRDNTEIYENKEFLDNVKACIDFLPKMSIMNNVYKTKWGHEMFYKEKEIIVIDGDRTIQEIEQIVWKYVHNIIYKKENKR